MVAKKASVVFKAWDKQICHTVSTVWSLLCEWCQCWDEHWQQSYSHAISTSLAKQNAFLNYYDSRGRTQMLNVQSAEWGFACMRRLVGLLAQIAQGMQSVAKQLSDQSVYMPRCRKGVARAISLWKPLVLHSTASLFCSQTLPEIEIVWICCRKLLQVHRLRYLQLVTSISGNWDFRF